MCDAGELCRYKDDNREITIMIHDKEGGQYFFCDWFCVKYHLAFLVEPPEFPDSWMKDEEDDSECQNECKYLKEEIL
ncbi:MAG: hypothetical protein ACTSRU_11605 [Candidatus Hodarchaeales archaeon]